MGEKEARIASLREAMRAIETGSARSVSEEPSARKFSERSNKTKQALVCNEPSRDFNGSGKPDKDAKSEFTVEAALQKAVRLVNHREHSECSLRKRLVQARFPESIADEAVARAVELGLVNNARYADILVRSRVAQGKGRQGIEQELRREGIDPESIDAYVEYRDIVAPENEALQAARLLMRRPPKAKNQREAAYRRLRQKGYDNATTQEAIRIWEASREEE